MSQFLSRLTLPLLVLFVAMMAPGASAQVSGACNGCSVVGSTAPTVVDIVMTENSFVKLTVERSPGVCMGGPIPGGGTICTESYCSAEVVLDIQGMGSWVNVLICHYPAPESGMEPEVERDDCILPMPRTNQQGDLYMSWDQQALCGIPTDISVDLDDALPALTQQIDALLESRDQVGDLGQVVDLHI